MTPLSPTDEERIRRVEELVVRWDERFRILDNLTSRLHTLETGHTNVLVTLGGMKVKWGFAASLIGTVAGLATGLVLILVQNVTK